MPKVVMFAGAPAFHAWTEADLTVNDFLPAFSRFLTPAEFSGSFGYSTFADDFSPAISSGKIPAWRSIPVEDGHLPTGYSQNEWVLNAHGSHLEGQARSGVDENQGRSSSFWTDSPSISSMSTPGQEDLDEEVSQYLERSFALHEKAASSQIMEASNTPILSRHRHPTARLSISTVSSLSSLAPLGTKRPETQLPASLPNLTDLSALPTAPTLASLEPQTVTVDLIVGVISLSQPRSVTIRRTGRAIELVEALVGDETRAGFRIAFWLPEHIRERPNDVGLRLELEGVRQGDVVCVRNVALSHFRGVVQGQSLGRRGRSGAETSVVRVRDRFISVGGQGIERKVEAVREWTKSFVRAATLPILEGGQSRNRRGKAKSRRLIEDGDLPPDESQ